MPLSVERKTPPLVPAKRFVPETPRALTSEFVKPLLAAVQVVPLLLERKTPLAVPAKRFIAEKASKRHHRRKVRWSGAIVQ